MKPKQWYIKERRNSQLGTYYVACGPLSKTAAKAKTRCLYGENTMHSFASEKEYNAKLASLREAGERVQS